MTMGGDFSLDWNGDLTITPSGSIQLAVGWTQVRQRIIRRIITNPAGILPDKTFSPADDVFNPDFGVGLGKLVDQSFSDDFEAELQRRIAQGVLEDQDVDSTIPPSIIFQRPNPSTLVIVIGLTLITGVPGTISIQVTQ